MQNTEEIWRLVDAKQDDFMALSATASGACPNSATAKSAPAPNTPRCWSSTASA